MNSEFFRTLSEEVNGLIDWFTNERVGGEFDGSTITDCARAEVKIKFSDGRGAYGFFMAETRNALPPDLTANLETEETNTRDIYYVFWWTIVLLTARRSKSYRPYPRLFECKNKGLWILVVERIRPEECTWNP